ncbi:hypothetical protein Y032_0328g2639 [Ancylostoma ceylanicum]|uniref:Uncharacterized protein n=1 Tax=Ancylostoma ceylanicum TaxID=53326 RepID=A0A016RZP4_9BILA|nr:hypothetical protein Y032_0328g2639 [Ancylostoma ceylanicum]
MHTPSKKLTIIVHIITGQFPLLHHKYTLLQYSRFEIFRLHFRAIEDPDISDFDDPKSIVPGFPLDL